MASARATGVEMVVLCLDAGFEVTVAEESDESLEQGVSKIIEHYDARVALGRMTDEAVEQTLDRMHAVSGYRTLGEADIVIDPAPGTSRERMTALDAAMRAGAVLALATEGVEVGEAAAMTGRAADVLGLRFPVGLRVNRLVEFSADENAGPKAVATGRAFLRKLDRLILDVEPAVGGIGTRLIEALHAAADLCLEDGARVGQIDAALRDWGIPFGSFALRDIVGMKRPGSPVGRSGQPGGGLDEVLMRAGRLGIAAGRGYYLYPQPGKPGVEDAQIAALAEADRAKKGIRPRELSDGEIRMRVVAAMAGTGAQLLAEGAVRRPADIDMVAVHGLGFARRTGGVMFAADLLELIYVRQRLAEMSRRSGRIAPPATMFQDLIRSGKYFDDLNA